MFLKTEGYLSEWKENKTILNFGFKEKSVMWLRSVPHYIQANDLDERVGNELDIY